MPVPEEEIVQRCRGSTGMCTVSRSASRRRVCAQPGRATWSAQLPLRFCRPSPQRSLRVRRCDFHCPNSLLTVVGKAMDAIWSDVLSVVRLISSCLGAGGISGCVCQLALTLQPEWRKVSTNPKVRCESGDAFAILVSRIGDLIVTQAEKMVNWLVNEANKAINKITGWFGAKNLIKMTCFVTSWRPDRCLGGKLTPEQREALSLCEDESRGLSEMCYYARARARNRTTRRVPPRVRPDGVRVPR